MAARSAPVRLPSAVRPLRAQARPSRVAASRAVPRAAMAPYGFIGLGIMGEAMARNLLKLGAGVVVYNRSSDKVRHVTLRCAAALAACRSRHRGRGSPSVADAALRSVPRW